MKAHDNVQAIIDTAREAAGQFVQGLDTDERFVLLPGGTVVDVDRMRHDEAQRRAAQLHPERLTGTSTVDDAASFLHVWGKHRAPQAELWADRADATITAIFNAHHRSNDTTEGQAGFRDHRAVLRLRKTAQWGAWEAISGKPLGQAAAAEFIEDRSPDFVAPTGATMLEIAQSVRATKGVKFEATRRLTSGETTLDYSETIEAKAGKRGSLAIPDVVDLLLQPFEGGPAYDVQARFRYRIDDGDLRLILVLVRPQDILRDAFDAVAQQVAAAVPDVPVVYGKP